ncbi:fumarylacetoacetate hydrolase family protein [Aestuariirhabdus litorea]|uniref:Fumarylacetoacetate hydrolase family protein n=1 Tax=Aestuariirhabdus litorea TaxID=2528527 RepID=A0A3P3VJJ5_9GAMM|nr:fumarylacetoacetate hydrolase family protein [Aestuariirhabdus litorea]RRJ82487.1 fumarylacetoacetate hydrolase family protein [Aestuariirhabdus litorea]RWW92648.1 fumarylacetoacetate hydrolase family protein [Endozoicomonadaceae bacterium GTF-13]
MKYQHQWYEGREIDLPVGKVVCVGRNYAAHALELNNPIPDTPILFIKPSTALVPLEESLSLPSQWGEVHYETELAILVGEPLSGAGPEQAVAAITGIGLALDLTLRDLQSELKSKGHPWERAKAFDGACPLSRFVPVAELGALDKLHFTLSINGEPRQSGDSGQMLTPIAALLAHASESFTLLPGDVVLTGTPAGVGVLQARDQLQLDLQSRARFSTRVMPS